MDLSASIQKVEQEILKRLQDAERAIEGLSQTWTGSGIPGEIDISLSNPEAARQAAVALEEAIGYANEQAEIAVRNALDYAVSSAVWGWRDGTRDIVDTGKLRDSLAFSSSGDGFEFWYNSPYAAFVHYGGYVRPYGNTKVDAVYIPGRPWVDAVMLGNGPVDAVDLDRIYDDAIARAFR
jgi:phage gpG-like protein